MGKNPGYLPSWVMTVGAMIDHQALITWSCATCSADGRADLLRIAREKGIDYSLVDRTTACRVPGCGGVVSFRYAASAGTPSRPLRALRERQDALQKEAAKREMSQAKALYNAVAKKHGRPPIP